MRTIYPTDHTTINLYGSENGIKADISHNYGKYTYGDQVRENIGFRSVEIKTKNMGYAIKAAKKYWAKTF